MYKTLAPGPIGVDLPFEESARLAAKYGFEGITVSGSDVERMGVDTIRRILEQNNLLPGVTGIPVNFREDDATFARDMEDLPTFAKDMSSVGCKRVATWFKPWHETLPFEKCFEQLRRRTARICEVLADYDMRYGLEFVGPKTSREGKPHPFIHDLDGLLELIDAVGADNLGVLLDSYHWYTSGGMASDLEKLSDDLVVAVHVNDAPAGVPRDEQLDPVRAMPGETGVIDMETFMGALRDMAYSGPVIVEPFSERIRSLADEEAIKETARSLERIW
ncbi:MAG: sugar phosphate isomerase/epimerase family protein [Chloroflexota bacterium]|nr:sugar phosphate isomerase/epimerase family protein [Chloroflexota bacterium]